MVEINKETLKRLLIDYLNPSEKKSVDFSTINNMDQLISYWENTSFGSETRKLIESRMAELLPTITDIGQLMSYRKNTTHRSEARRVI